METEEADKFNRVISEAYQELLTKRPEKGLHHFIYYMLSTLPDHMRNKD